MRTVIEERNAQQSRDIFATQNNRFQDTWDGMIWFLARTRDFSEFTVIEEIDEATRFLFRSEGNQFGVPSIAVVFTVTNDTLTIHDLRID